MDQKTKTTIAATLRAAANKLEAASSFPKLSEVRQAMQTVAAMPHPKAATETDPAHKARMNTPATIAVSQSTVEEDGTRFPVFKVTYSTLRSDQTAAMKAVVERLGLEVVEKDVTSGRWDWKDIIWLAPKGLHPVSKQVLRLRPLD